jgi:hypothetical protein
MARCFHKIKLHNYKQKKIERAIMRCRGKDDYVKRIELGGSYLRSYRRLFLMRAYYHRWWGKIVDMVNHQLLLEHNWTRLVRPRFVEWKEFAQFQAMIKRNNKIAEENARHLHGLVPVPVQLSTSTPPHALS